MRSNSKNSPSCTSLFSDTFASTMSPRDMPLTKKGMLSSLKHRSLSRSGHASSCSQFFVVGYPSSSFSMRNQISTDQSYIVFHVSDIWTRLASNFQDDGPTAI